MPKALIFDRFASAIVKLERDRVEHPVEAGRLPGLDTEGDDVLDLEVDGISDPDAMADSVLHHLERRSLDPEHLADEGASPSIGPPICPPNTALSFSIWSSLASSSTNMPSRQLPSVMTFGESTITADLPSADVRALDLAVANVEDERGTAIVVRRTVVERQIARAHEIAGARLEVAALQIPGHIDLPLPRGPRARFSTYQPTCQLLKKSALARPFSTARSDPRRRFLTHEYVSRNPADRHPRATERGGHPAPR